MASHDPSEAGAGLALIKAAAASFYADNAIRQEGGKASAPPRGLGAVFGSPPWRVGCRIRAASRVRPLPRSDKPSAAAPLPRLSSTGTQAAYLDRGEVVTMTASRQKQPGKE